MLTSLKRPPQGTLPILAALLALGAASLLHAAVGDVVTAPDDTTIGEVEARLETINDIADDLIGEADELIDIAEEENEEVPEFAELIQQVIDNHVQSSLLGCKGGCNNPRFMVSEVHEGGLLERVIAIVDSNLANAEFSSIPTGESRAFLDAAQAHLLDGDGEAAFGAACDAFHAVGSD